MKLPALADQETVTVPPDRTIASGVGDGFTTVTSKLVEAVPAFASRTVTVIVAVPAWPVAGVTVTARFVPLPPKTTFGTGTRAGFDEDTPAESVSAPAAVSASPTVKG